MMKEIFEKYRKNFSKFSIYFALSVIIELISFKLKLPFTNASGIGQKFNFESFFSIDLLKVIVISLVEIYITAYGLTIIRHILLENPIDQNGAFSNAFSYYSRLLIFNLIFIGITIIVILLSIVLVMLAPNNLALLAFNTIFFLIATIVLSIFLGTIQNYMVYYDDNIRSSIKQGIKIGKRYFIKILGLLIIAAILGGIVSSKIFKTNIITLSLGILITTIYSMYLNIYIMNLCKNWGWVN